MNNSAPIGTIIIFPGQYLPLGWCLCHGQEIEKKTITKSFNQLAKSIGLSNYTSLDKLKLPDLKDQFLIGANGKDTIGSYKGKPHLHSIGINSKINNIATIKTAGLHHHSFPTKWKSKNRAYNRNSQSLSSGINHSNNETLMPNISDHGWHSHSLNPPGSSVESIKTDKIIYDEPKQSEFLNRPAYIALNFIIKIFDLDNPSTIKES